MTTIETLIRDLRHAGRVLLKAPGFTTAAVPRSHSIIGANTAIVSVVRSVMLRSLPRAEPGAGHGLVPLVSLLIADR